MKFMKIKKQRRTRKENDCHACKKVNERIRLYQKTGGIDFDEFRATDFK